MGFQGLWYNGSGGGGGGTLATPRAIIPQIEIYRGTNSNDNCGWFAGYTQTTSQLSWPQWGRMCRHYEDDVYYCDHSPIRLCDYGNNTNPTSLARWSGIYTYDDSEQQFSTTLSNAYNYIGTSYIGDATDPKIIKIDYHAVTRSYISPEPFDLTLEGPTIVKLGGGTLGGLGLVKQQTKYVSFGGSAGGGAGVKDNRVYPCLDDHETPNVWPYATWFMGQFPSVEIVRRGFAQDYEYLKFSVNWDWGNDGEDWLGTFNRHWRLRGISGLSKGGTYPLMPPTVCNQHLMNTSIGATNPWGQSSTAQRYVQLVIQPQLFIRSVNSIGIFDPFPPSMYNISGTIYSSSGVRIDQWDN